MTKELWVTDTLNVIAKTIDIYCTNFVGLAEFYNS